MLVSFWYLCASMILPIDCLRTHTRPRRSELRQDEKAARYEEGYVIGWARNWWKQSGWLSRRWPDKNRAPADAMLYEEIRDLRLDWAACYSRSYRRISTTDDAGYADLARAIWHWWKNRRWGWGLGVRRGLHLTLRLEAIVAWKTE